MEPLDGSAPTEIGPYRLLAELGRGGMGRVFLGAARDGRLAAVKQVHPRFASDDDFRARFRREVAASRTVSGAYTAAVMAADADSGLPWLASVFVTGPSLGAAVRETGPLPEAAARRLALGLATALVEIHRVNLIHRDLKPENVLLAGDGVRVIDFGIVRAAETTGATELTQTGWVIGSPPYMSPEQAEGRDLTPASDVFSLGAVLALALTGRAPFAGTSTLQTLYNVVHHSPDLEGVPAGLRGILEECLAKSPSDRPTPARLLTLLGPVPPAARAWPSAIHDMVAAQEARIDALLSGAEAATVVVPPRRVTAPVPAPGRTTPASLLAKTPTAATAPADPAATALPAAPTAPLPAGVPPAGPVPDRPTLAEPPSPAPQAPLPRRRRPGGGALVALVVLALAGAGVGGYFLTRQEATSHAATPDCDQVSFSLPGAVRLPERDVAVALPDGRENRCSWEADRTVVEVSWTLRTGATAAEATERQVRAFAAGRGDARGADLSFGDEAYWAAAPQNPAGSGCSLRVRDANLVVTVDLTPTQGSSPAGDRVPDCEAKAEGFARSAYDAMP
ncbi:protein kinase [Streptomyces sp. NPDC058052]|uniref:serine/threonine-protein kinase n=1 Tax=Streptomyces sp. NPDC058052 TaxID=3346316 RepID=UPI0036E03312